jgi:hypothetical protein
MADQESFNESDEYVLADNLETSCHLSKYFNKCNEVLLPVFSGAGTFEKASNIGTLDVTWCTAGNSDDSDCDSDDNNSDDEDDGHVLRDSAGLACTLLQRREVLNNLKDPTPICKGNTRSADSASQNGAKCVSFPPEGKEVSRYFECPWVQKSDDYCALFYSSREIQQMTDSQIAESDEFKTTA